MHQVLIVANQTIGSTELTAAVTRRLRAHPACSFHLLVPVAPTPPPAIAVGLAAAESAATAVLDVPDQRSVAADRLERGLEWLAELGATATGRVAVTDPVDAVVVAARGIDEIIVSTLPSRLSRWLRQDLPSKIRRSVDIPVEVVTTAAAPDGQD